MKNQGYVKRVEFENVRTGEVKQVKSKGFDPIDNKKGVKYRSRMDQGIMLNNKINLFGIIGESKTDYANLILLMTNLDKDTNIIWYKTSKKDRPATITDIQKLSYMKSERSTGDFIDRMVNLGVIGVITTIIEMDGLEDRTVCYCINPLYATNGGYVSLEIYNKFKKWLEPHLTSAQKDFFTELEARLNDDEEEVEAEIEIEDVDPMAEYNKQQSNSLYDTTERWLHKIGAKLLANRDDFKETLADTILEAVMAYTQDNNKDAVLKAGKGFVVFYR